MNICSESDHGEIVYEGRYCGACDAIKEFKGQVESLKAEIDDLKATAVAAKGGL